MEKAPSLYHCVIAISLAICCLASSFLTAQEDKAAPKARLAAMFIKNRAGTQFDSKIPVFEDLLTGEITDMGFRVMSPEDTVKALQTFAGVKPDQTIPGAKLDELLENNTSALRLAQNMGVDYMILASITTFGKDSQLLRRPDLGIDRKITTFKLRTTYKILDASIGDSISAGNILSTQKIQEAEGVREETDLLNDLLSDAAKKISAELKAKGGTEAIADARKQEGAANFIISCSMQDLSVPEVVKDEAGNYTLTGNRYKLEPISVTVELDGVVIGTAPGNLTAAPGLHKMRLSREGFEDWERTINIREGQQLNVAMTLTAEGRAYWLQMAEFFARMKREERLSEADAELIRGVAQKMRQSGVRIDSKSDVKVDTKDAPTINQTTVNPRTPTETIWP